MADSTLTPKQRAFVAEYIVDKNATAAARRAGYKGSDKTLSVTGCELLANPKVKAAIVVALLAQEKRTGITADRVLAGIQQIAEFGDGEANRLRAYELLGKHLALFTERTVLANPDGSALAPARVEVVLVKP